MRAGEAQFSARKKSMSDTIPSWDQLVASAQKVVGKTLQALPEPLAAEATQLPVTYEAVPSPELEAEGIDPDTLGLFTGPSFGEEYSALASVPAQIILFLENLWAVAEGDWKEYRREIRTTYLHELGHYLGLDESELEQRGLE